jgi:acetyl esterase/lipase
MALSSPVLDQTWTNPDIPLTDDPIFAHLLPVLQKSAQQFADDLSLTDPLVSPQYGSLAGLPSTAGYAGSHDVTAPDIIALQQKTSLTPGADFTFVLRKGEPHDWASVTILPETKDLLPGIYEQLGIVPAA